VASFTGLTRGALDDTDRGPVDRLVLDAYPGFTETVMQGIEAEARARFAIQDVLAVHRWGPIAVGEPIVFVAVAAAHRRAAFRGRRLPDGPVQDPRTLLEEGGGPGRRALDRAARSGSRRPRPLGDLMTIPHCPRQAANCWTDR
jgi:hypothetical protein